MIESVSLARPRRKLLIGTAAALLAELCALVYMMDAYRGFWGEGAIGIFVFAVGMLVPSLLVLDRMKSRPNAVDAAAPRRLLAFGFVAGAIGVGLTPRVGAHGAAAVLLWLLAPQAVLHTMAFRRLGGVRG
jgi:hypothetical protein